MYINSENINEMAKVMFAKRKCDVNKGSFGRAAIFGSSSDFVGAVKLAALGELSMRMGTGYSILAVPKEILPSISPNVFECVVSPQKSENGKFVFCEESVNHAIKNASSVAIGMGMGKSEEVLKLVEYIFDNFAGNVVIDADGLNSITMQTLQRTRKCNLVITPHLKEFSRIYGESVESIKSNACEIAVAFAKTHNLTLLLKDYQSLITNGNQTFLVTDGSPSLAKAGSGDFLAGSIAGLAANFPIFNSAAVAADIIAKSSSDFSREYNDNIMLARDLFQMVASYIKGM